MVQVPPMAISLPDHIVWVFVRSLVFDAVPGRQSKYARSGFDLGMGGLPVPVVSPRGY
ncbi:hypothetical protein EGR_01833 [Echinococcus granulosus]|uniref:Uncharacterized protein n=1 Tax=Echinococcus granulosus TaxID=6210 RepID=W6UXQ0_ECHGR|nr:hypothetical protein EGR_01833 [Echinococcus granulosus]EUB63342.1 hypothetical protein EGR_01833 [Echinococcus granulosus]